MVLSRLVFDYNQTALVVVIKRRQGETVFNPSAETFLEADDPMIVTGLAGSMNRVFDHSA